MKKQANNALPEPAKLPRTARFKKMNMHTEPAIQMPAERRELLTFHMTGKRHGGGLDAIDSLELRPALLAGYRDLTRLRYDYPVVLIDDPVGNDYVRSLSGLVNEVLLEVAPRGIEGERLRKHGLQLEKEIRALAADGTDWTLTELWAMAAARLGAHAGQTLEQVLVHAAGALKIDGQVLDCARDMPAQFITHAWKAAQEEKARKFRAEVGRLMVKLSDILRAAFIHSEAGRCPQALKAGFGKPYQQAFDFEVMSRLLGKRATQDELPESRRRRIEWALGTLKAQRFYGAPANAPELQGREPHNYVFDNCAAAVDAFRQRLPEVVELAKAMSIAELEIDGRYNEANHDPFFTDFTSESLGPDDLAMFPDYLVCIDPGHSEAPENAKLMEVLSAHLPIKVLVQTEDVLDGSSIGAGYFGFGVRSVQLASAAIGLNDVFVLQSASSNLYQVRDRIYRGMNYSGAALFSVFAGSAAPASALPPYLTAAAAMQSRAFPAFTYNPGAGPDLASRFSLEDNPQPEAGWPVEAFEYANEELQRVSETVAFTLVDFVACDRRYARHFARVPRAQWCTDMVPVADWLACSPEETTGKVPYVLAVDTDDVLHRLIMDAKLVQAARRCREFWHRLQELGGVHNSHAERLLAREKAAWEEKRQQELASLKAETASTPGAAPAAAAAAASAPAAASPAAPGPELPPERSPDEAYIETERCTTCEECRNINDKMFAYNENKQAYSADINAGNYRQLVEAAESCQVAIIHPGKPRNPNEPDLDDLIKRAETFM